MYREGARKSMEKMWKYIKKWDTKKRETERECWRKLKKKSGMERKNSRSEKSCEI